MFEADPTPAEQIEQLEAEIDELREAIQRSRRLVVGRTRVRLRRRGVARRA